MVLKIKELLDVSISELKYPLSINVFGILSHSAILTSDTRSNAETIMAEILSASLPINDPTVNRSSMDRMSHSFTSPRHGPSCWCCPYGYHIDLDFVRYCEGLTQEPKKPGASQSQQQRRDRRRQRRSMEVMLGFEQIAELQQAQIQSPLYEVCIKRNIVFISNVCLEMQCFRLMMESWRFQAISPLSLTKSPRLAPDLHGPDQIPSHRLTCIQSQSYGRLQRIHTNL